MLLWWQYGRNIFCKFKEKDTDMTETALTIIRELFDELKESNDEELKQTLMYTYVRLQKGYDEPSSLEELMTYLNNNLDKIEFTDHQIDLINGLKRIVNNN